MNVFNGLDNRIEYATLRLAASVRNRLWSIPWRKLQHGYSSPQKGHIADPLVTIERWVTQGLARGSNVLISPWLEVQIFSSPPSEIMTNNPANRGKLLVTFLFLTKGFAGGL